MRRRARAVTAGGVVAFIALAALTVRLSPWWPDEPSTAGPLVAGEQFGVSLTLPVGARGTFGASVVTPQGEGSVTVLSVRPENLKGPLEYLGSVLAGPDRRYGGLPTSDGFPPGDPDLGPTRQSEGAVLTTDEPTWARGWEILVGYRMTGPGVGMHDALLIEYEAEGERYKLRVPGALTICSGRRGDPCESHHSPE